MSPGALGGPTAYLSTLKDGLLRFGGILSLGSEEALMEYSKRKKLRRDPLTICDLLGKEQHTKHLFGICVSLRQKGS